MITICLFVAAAFFGGKVRGKAYPPYAAPLPLHPPPTPTPKIIIIKLPINY